MTLRTGPLHPSPFTRCDSVPGVLYWIVKSLGTRPLCVWIMAAVFCSGAARAQTNEWTWMGGSLTAGNFGVYGTPGTPAPTNAPGARAQPVTWTDIQGNLWLFGGFGFDSVGNWGYLNDLWKFNPATSEWTWVGGSDDVGDSLGVGGGTYGESGTPAIGNIPPGRSGGVGWTDAKGNLWLFGGFSYSYTGITSYFNDLWEYSPATNEWAWISGSSQANQSGTYGTLGAPASGNVPGGRNNALSWTDGKGNLWLFGGAGYDSAGYQGNLNDLWEFNASTNQWTWVSGSNTMNQPGVPGTLGTPAVGNVPAGRNAAVGWTDNNGNFWLFGGVGINDVAGSALGSNLNDLWEYNPATNEWAWMGGVSTTTSYVAGQPGVYGTLQTPAASNAPGSRADAVGWTDSKGNLWMFSGEGFDSTDTQGFLNDLWEFSTANKVWTWMGGSNSVNGVCPVLSGWCGQLGVYGTEHVSALGSSPGGRYDGAGWTDAKGNLWLFGGLGIDGDGNGGLLGDLWQFQPNTNGQPVAATPIISPGSGTYTSWQTVTIDDATPGATIDYLINGNPPASQYTGPITVSTTETIEAIASATGYANSNVAMASYTTNLPVTATPTFSVAPGTYATAQTVTISDATPGATIYYAIGATYTTAFSVYSGPITVSSSETLQAMAVAENYLNSATASGAYIIGPNPSGQWTWMGGSNLIPAGCSAQGGCGAAGWYGTLRVAAPSNFPGARSNASTWADSKGNFWLFGGLGYDSAGESGALNDLWEFSPSTGEWTWMNGGNTVTCTGSTGCGMQGVYGTLGTPGAANTPGGRIGAASWTDSNGNLWLFGGWGFDGAGSFGYLNDVWKFDASTDEWTWMGGGDAVPCLYCGQPGQYGTFETPAPGNIPGGRVGPTEWTDHNGNIWIFGGLGYDSRGEQGYLNDFWEFNPSTNEWTWVGGNNFISNFVAGWPGVYGELGVPATGNIPWSLEYPASWTDNGGNLWLFGGIGVDTSGDGYYLNDMWEFYPSLNEWAWTSANSVSAPGGSWIGVYGTMGNFAPANIPGERYESATWTDSNGNFWLLGGAGVENVQAEVGWLNDFWEFDPSINEWRWMSGSSSIPFESWGAAGQYGTFGTPAPGNTPGGRYNAATWRDASGNLWLFGGAAFDAQGSQGTLNDLWEYTLAGTPILPPPTPTASPTFSLAAGAYTSAQAVTIADQTAGSTIYYTTNGTPPNAGSPVYSAPISIPTSETVEAVAVAAGHAVSPIASAAYTINLPAAAAPAFSLPGGPYNSAQTVAITDATSGATIYYTTDGTTPTTSSTVYGGAITVSASETIEAIAVASGYASSAVASATYTINLPPPTFTLGVSPGSLSVNSGGQGTATLTITPQSGFNSAVSFACSGLPVGASCSFSPATVTPSGGDTVTTQLTISAGTSSASASPASERHRRTIPPGATLALASVFLFFSRRRGFRRLLGLMFLVVGMGVISGCGSSGAANGGGGGMQQTSTVTITATSGSIQQSSTITLTVN